MTDKDHRELAAKVKSVLNWWPTYIGYCCREWVLAAGVPVGTCGLCGERPTYLREDT